MTHKNTHTHTTSLRGVYWWWWWWLHVRLDENNLSCDTTASCVRNANSQQTKSETAHAHTKISQQRFVNLKVTLLLVLTWSTPRQRLMFGSCQWIIVGFVAIELAPIECGQSGNLLCLRKVNTWRAAPAPVTTARSTNHLVTFKCVCVCVLICSSRQTVLCRAFNASAHSTTSPPKFTSHLVLSWGFFSLSFLSMVERRTLSKCRR